MATTITLENGQTFSTRAGGDSIAVVRRVSTEGRIEWLNARLVRLTRQLNEQLAEIAEVGFVDETTQKKLLNPYRTEVTAVSKELDLLRSLVGKTHYELVSWHGRVELANARAKRVGGIVVVPN